MKYILSLVLVLMLSTSAAAAEFIGKVVAVTDGDTVKVLTQENAEVKVRLAAIDAPEAGQPYGQKSKQALSDIVFGKTVTVTWNGKDRYGRTVGFLILDGKDVNTEMVASGNAWVYRQYSKDTQLLKVEQQARDSKRGLWALQADQIMPPWEWRKQKKARSRG